MFTQTTKFAPGLACLGSQKEMTSRTTGTCLFGPSDETNGDVQRLKRIITSQLAMSGGPFPLPFMCCRYKDDTQKNISLLHSPLITIFHFLKWVDRGELPLFL
uniref:Uncharacterized protein n=1 Tax=Opuntia streptacantha TaxID=393608 RepID=A0A7C9CZ28_OPUST